MNAARLLSLALMSSVALATPAFAQETATRPPATAQDPEGTPAPGSGAPDLAPRAPVVTRGIPDLPSRPPAIPEIWAPSPIDGQGRSAYGLFLAGRSAVARGDAGGGAVYLRRALALTPEQPAVRDQAFATNLLGGDLAFAGRITPDGEDVPPLVTEAGRLVSVVQLLDRDDARGALAEVDARPIARPHQRAGRLLTPWLAAAAGDWDRALAPVRAVGPDATTIFLRADRARLLEIRRRNDEAEVEWRAVLGTSLGRRLFALDYGEFLERRGKRREAAAFYEGEISGGATDPRLVPAQTRASGRGRPPAVLDLRRGAAGAMATAALQATAEGQYEFAAVYLRLAHDLSPSDMTLLNLGEALIQAQLDEPGREALAGVSTAEAAVYAAAQLAIGQSLARDGEIEAALDPLRRAAAAAPQATDVAAALAERLNALGRHGEALEVLAGPAAPTAAMLSAQAVALRGLGRDAEAEAALLAVLATAPDDPVALSLLGALWLDAQRVEEGAALIVRAAAVAPGDAAVQGALGWSQYRRGLYDEAVSTLEAAVEARPADAAVNDHLGDAYWQVGRRREARFQWSRALTLAPDAKLKAAVERKLEVGLDGASSGG